MMRLTDFVANRPITITRFPPAKSHMRRKYSFPAGRSYNSLMLPVREEDVEDRKYHQDLATVRERILGFVLRRLVPHRADFAQAEDIAQSCVIALWEQYPDKRELAEMVRIAIGAARHKIPQLHR